MKGFKTTLASLIMCLAIISLSSIHAEASSNVISLEKTTLSQCKDTMTNIINAVIEKDSNKLSEYSNLFVFDSFDKLSKYTTNNGINCDSMSSIAIDFTYPDNSSTGDTVIMCNTKLEYSNYNKLYLFEFHVNKDGLIYGYNIWQY